MKYTSKYNFLAIFIIISSVVNGSDCDSPQERSLVPHLDTSRMERDLDRMRSDLVSTMRTIRVGGLNEAIRANNLEAVQKIIDAKAEDVNLGIFCAPRPLIVGAYIGCELSIIRALINAGADVNKDQSFFGTPLANAIEQKRVEHVRVLLEAGANINYQYQRRSLLFWAVDRDQLEIAKMLLAAGATADTESLRRAIAKGNLDMVKTLVEGGANVNATDNTTSVLGWVDKNDQKIIDYLESKGAVRFWGESCSIQ